MKKLILITGVLFLSLNSYGSTVYISGGRVQDALESAYAGTDQSWVAAQSCTLCHNNLSGGNGNINPGFGALYQSVGGTGGSRSVSDLEGFFTNATLTTEDSDSDGFTNLQEFMAGSNPVDDMDTPEVMNPNTGGNNTSTGGGGGGCGLVDDSGQSSFVESSTVFGMFFLPLLFTFGFRRRSRKA